MARKTRTKTENLFNRKPPENHKQTRHTTRVSLLFLAASLQAVPPQDVDVDLNAVSPNAMILIEPQSPYDEHGEAHNPNHASRGDINKYRAESSTDAFGSSMTKLLIECVDEPGLVFRVD